MTVQGMHLQGTSLQGIALNGFDLHGTTVSAQTPNRLLEPAVEGATLSAVLNNGRELPLTITSVERDADDPDLTFYSLEGPDRQNLCGPGGKGLFVRGIWDAKGHRRDDVKLNGRSYGITFSCTLGVIAKCVRWGYKPWVVGPDLHQACTRMARADYCGDGTPHTRDGTLIDLYDVFGIQKPEATGDLTFEAGWGTNGAVCVTEPRYVLVDPNGEPILPSCWSQLPRCETLEQAADFGALLGNSSAHTTEMVCE